MLARPLAWLSCALLALALSASVATTFAAAAPDDSIRYVYDDAGRLRAVSDPAAETASYSWDAVGNLLSVRRVGSMSLSVIQASPTKGEVGTTVRIYGTGFKTVASDNTVKFNGTPATLTSATRTQLVVKVPAGATTGPVTVTTLDGTATSADPFVVSVPNRPVVSGVTPNFAAPGDVVTVTGTNFGDRATNVVAVNGVRGDASNETPTSLSFTVPKTEASGRVSVTNLEGTGTGPDLFVAPPFYPAADIGATGRLNIGETKTYTLTAPKKIALLVFDATAGQRVGMLPNISVGNGSIDWRLIAPDGSRVQMSLDDPITMPQTGTYTFFVETFGSTGTRTGTLKLWEVPPDQEHTIVPTLDGTQTTLTFPVEQQNARVTFEGHAGQYISIRGTTASGDYSVPVYQPDGSFLGSNGIFSITPSGENFFDAVTELPVDGTYTIFVDPSATTTGSVTLTAYDATPLREPLVPTGEGAVKDVVLSAPGRNAELSVEGTAGRRLALRMQDSTFTTTWVRIMKPDGTTLVSQFGVPAGGAFIDAQLLPTSGTYRIIVDPLNASTGSIRLIAYDVPPDLTETITPTRAGVSKTFDIPVAGQNARLSFAAQAGQAVSVKGSAVGMVSNIAILNSAGAKLSGRSEPFSVSPSALNFFDAERIPSDGTYEVLVDPQGQGTGSITVTVHDATEVSRPITPTPEGVTETLPIEAPGQNGRLTFTGTAGQRVAVKGAASLSSSLTMSVLKPDGSVLNGASTSFGGAGTDFVDTVTLPSAGTYSVFIDPWNVATGSVAVTVYNVPADVADSIAPSSAGDTKTLTTMVPGQNGKLTFSGTAGQRISLRTVPQSYTPASSAWVSVLNPNGSVLRSRTRDSFIEPVTLPTTGTYTIVVDPDSAAVGSATVTAWAVPPDATTNVTPIAAGAAGTVDTPVPGQNGKVSFNGTVGQRISVQINSKTYPGWAVVMLRRPDGTNLSLISNVGDPGFANPITLPVTGQYTLFIDPGGADTGAMTVTLYDVPPDSTASFTPSASGTVATATNAFPGQSARLTWSGSAGQRVSINITAKSYSDWAHVSVLKPDGTVLFNHGNVTSVPQYIDALTLPTAGTYTILVDPQGPAVGDVTMRVYDVPADFSGTIAFTSTGGSQTVTTATPGQNGKLTFSGTQGQKASLRATSTTYSSARVSMQRPDGTNLISPATLTSPFTFATVTLPTTGTYTIVVDPQSLAIGGMGLSLTDVSGSGLAMTTARRSGMGGAFTSLAGGAPVNGALLLPAITGRVLAPDGSGLANARVSADGRSTRTDRTGDFVLERVGSGRRVLSVDARTAGEFGRLRVPVAVRPTNTTALPYAIWMPRLERARLRGRTVTTRRAPGLSVRLPARSTVGAVRIGAVPIDRPPFPLPRGRKLMAAFTVQWQGRRLAQGADVTYPNNARLAAGTRVGLWSFDAARSRWQSYGRGTVTADRTRIVAKGGARVRDLAFLATSVSARAERRARHAKRASQVGEIAKAIRLPRPPSRRVVRKVEPLPHYKPASAESWHQSRRRLGRSWTSQRSDTPWTELKPLLAPSGITGLAGQALKLNGVPLAGVKMQLEGTEVSTRTDRTGRFLIEDVPAGRHVLVIDGRDVGNTQRYGVFEAQVQLERGQTKVLEYQIWMPALSRAGAVEIDRPTTHETVMKTPHIPGLEVHIPAGSYVRDRDGAPVRELSITPIPVDRPPFPLPPHVEVPIYFTVQPGGAYLSKGAQIIYPNYNHLPPGQRVDFWQYDPDQRGWHIYGRGTVTPDGKQVKPDPDVRIWELTGAMISNTPTPPGTWPFGWLEGGMFAGDPVDLSSGLFVYNTTDLTVSDAMPAEITRTYRPNDANSYSFGVGTTNEYEMRLWSPEDPSVQTWQATDLIMPDGGRVHYVRTSPGTDYQTAAMETTTTSGRFYKSKLTWNGDGWDLALRDGTVYVFGMIAPLQEIRDRFGNKVTLTRTDGETGNITQITTDNGRWIRFTYDTSNRITKVTDNGSRTVQYTYGSTGRLATMKNAKGGITTYTYDKSGRLEKIKDPKNTAVYLTNTYDTNGRVSKQTLGDAGVFTYAYTLAGGKVTKTRVTDPMGRVREVTFNGSGYPLSDSRAVGTPIEQNTTYERDPATNVLKSVTDELGRKTAYAHDAAGNVASVTRLAGTSAAQTSTFAYDPDTHQLDSSTDPLLHTTSYTYDAEERLTAVRDATNRETTYGYTNADSRPDSITDPGGKTTNFDYLAGDLVGIRDPLGKETRIFVDSVGRPLVVTDPTGRKTTRRYDDVNQLSKVIDSAGQATLFEHDPNGNLTKVTDARGGVNTMTYDAMNRLLTRVDGLNRTERFVYDKNGNLTKQTDRKGQVTTLQYDALDRLTFSGFGTTGTTTLTYQSSTSYAYDGADRVTGMTDSVAGAYTNVYDGLDRVTSQTTPVAAVGYGYDAAGRRTSLTVPGQAPVTYGYDDANRPLSIAQGGASVTFGYDPTGRRSSVTLANGLSEEYAYDDASRLTGITYRQGATVLGDLNYELDDAGRRTAIWGSYARTGQPQAMTSATYDAANQRTAQNGAALTYDANGNLTRDASGATFSWNARDQLASMANGATSASFVYDAAGRRQRKTVNGQATDFVYDGANVVQERRGGAVYADLLTGFGMDETFSRTSAAGTKHLLTDGLGSTLALTDPFGLPTTTYSYDPFGGSTQSGAASDNSFQYTGRENDGTGLYFNRNRYYSPGMGRFISEDPIGLAGGDANLYAYVGNTPMNATDPLGLYMEVNDNLSIPYGGYPVSTASPQAWQLGLGDAFPQLVGWDSYRNMCPWGKFAAHDCDPGENGFPDIGDPLGDAWDWANDVNARLRDVDRGIREVGRVAKKPPVRNCLIGGAVLGGVSRSKEGAAVGCALYNMFRKFK